MPGSDMLASDVVGLLASIALAIPAVRDQLYRFRQAGQQRKKTGSPWPGLRKSLAQGWQVKRDSFYPSDSLMVAGGAIGLCASFLLKVLAL